MPRLRLNATARRGRLLQGSGGTVLFVPESSTDVVFNALWDHGVCDGLEIAAHLIEAAMKPIPASAESHPILVALLMVLREAQLDMQLDPT